MQKFYRPAVSARLRSLQNTGSGRSANAIGSSAALSCGTYAHIYLEIDAKSKNILKAKFHTNGCGYMTAAADVLTAAIVGRKLIDLHGLDRDELTSLIEGELGLYESDRRHCLTTPIEALQAALNDFRSRQLEEFSGEKALICTCFGVTEETIEDLISHGKASSVTEIGNICNAGTGCGACQFMIREMLDSAPRATE